MFNFFSWIKKGKAQDEKEEINWRPSIETDLRDPVIIKVPDEVLQEQRQARIEAAQARQRELYWEAYYKNIKASIDPVFWVYDRYKDLIHEHQIVFQDWADANLDYLLPYGYEKYKVQSISRAGFTVCYCRRGLVEKNKEVNASFHKKRGQPFKKDMKVNEHAREMGTRVENQSLDHYSSVIQLHALLIHYNFTDIAVSHRKGADVTALYQGKNFCFEFENPKTHTVEGLKLRYLAQCKEFDYVKYIVPSEAYFKVVSAIGQPDTIRRGSQVLDFLNGV